MKLYDTGVYLLNGKDIVEDNGEALSKIKSVYGRETTKEEAAKNTMAYSILTSHNVSGNDKKLKIKSPSMDTITNHLSGGNQQKVIIAKWLLMNPVVLILDEPTRGVDVSTKAEIYRLMRELNRQGVAIIMVSSDMEELLGVSDRIVVMCQGRITGELKRNEFEQKKIMEYATLIG